MFNFKNSFAALAGVSLFVFALAATLSPSGAAQNGKEKQPRKFYLTKTVHNGIQAVTACATGYHMASLWEILDPSNLSYDTTLGFTTGDSGFGPPTESGWIRTGNPTSNLNTTGLGNCNAWMSDNPGDAGSMVGLSNAWGLSFTGTHISPWLPGLASCNVTNPVWCMQD